METPREETARLVSFDKILHRLREMFGEDRAVVAAGDDFRVDDEQSRVVASPHKIEELSEMLRIAHDERWRVIPAGAGTWLEMGNRPSQFHLVISTAKLNRVIEYEPADLTATIEAGCALTTFNKLASAHRQFIPLDPFGDERSTIGGTIATASSGPMRCAYGTPRDWLIGIRVVHADGQITRAGGKVVKNVAGYDLCKLYTGSFGTLAVIAEMSFKLRALPSSEKTLVFYADSANALCSLAARISDSDVLPTAMELISPITEVALPIDGNQFTLALRFLNEPQTVDSQIEEATQLGIDFKHTVLSETDANGFWRGYRETETSTKIESGLRLIALPSDLPAVIIDIGRVMPEANWRAHAANGVVRIHAQATIEPGRIAELRNLAQSRGGQLVILRAPSEVKNQLDVWGEVGQTAGLMRALKEKFDPQKQINPGRFVAGI
jgi:glycolate oxidase FAD binding subunit